MGLVLLAAVLLAGMVSFVCPVDDESEVKKIERECLDDYKDYDCDEEDSSLSSRIKKECENLRKCLINPTEEYHRRKNKPSKITEFF